MKTYSNSSIQSFIKKYYLNGLVENALWQIKGGHIVTKFKSGDNELGSNARIRGLINLNNCGLPDGLIGDYHSANLLKCLAILEERISVEYCGALSDGFIEKLIIKDKSKTEVHYSLSHGDLINYDGKGPVILFDIIARLDKSVFNKILNAVSATDSNCIALSVQNKKLCVVLGINSFAEIKIPINAKIVGTLENHILLDTNIAKAIIKCNFHELDNSVLKISSKGLVELEFTQQNLTATYWILCNQYYL